MNGVSVISRSSLSALACALLMLGASACSSEDVGSDDPAGGSTTALSTDVASSDTTASSGTTATAPPATSSVAPATGPLVSFGLGSYRLPADVDWRLTRGGLSAHATIDTATSIAFVDLAATEVTYGGTVEQSARLSLGQLRDEGRKVKRLPDREIGGRTVYVIEGQDKGGYAFMFGTSTKTSGMYALFEADKKTATTDAWLESVLASLTWK